MSALKIGWAAADLTPERPVFICGQFHARISEGIADPITATILALDSGQDHAVMVGCDYVAVSDALRDAVRSRIPVSCPDLDPMKLLMNATHTHTGPETRPPARGAGHISADAGVELDAMPVEEYLAFAADRIADAVATAWNTRSSGAVAYGQGFAVIGRNRRWVDTAGNSTMYGNTDTPDFSHIEGYEDHALNLLATRDSEGRLTGLIVNVPSSSQVSEQEYTLSADYWCETRAELRLRFGRDLFILPQCSAAGDQSPHLIFDKRATERMLALKNRTPRQEVAHRIADAVAEILPCIESTYAGDLTLQHRVDTLDLPLATLTEEDVRTATGEADKLHAQYLREKQKLEDDPKLQQQPRWYRAITYAYRRMQWYQGVTARFERQQTDPTFPAELHVLRLGEIALATNPFEYYLDFGTYIKARSPAVQTFLVQLTGQGTYVPSPRSVAGGGYGSIPASNPVGPEGGRQLADATIETLLQLWPDAPQ